PIKKELNSRWLRMYQKLVSNASSGGGLDLDGFKEKKKIYGFLKGNSRVVFEIFYDFEISFFI
ncbi:hypothetical protein KJQ98_09550, partial [Campylobacter sp. 2018MI27]|nr:hypothetical protein [Campylobacter sp. 2018MI27]